ncbi:glycosyltransferase [Aureimonas sp. AU20]|uniref:glycosyltransferase n=1 Tax=Aureimonas sp. AU20 TaxID=1349819 RepID=UPI00071FB88B|nr:glycosyltransferase [Aureimonas sp. AU20]ALN74691.1 hypothetical protein M673_18390 [Aureimonas sp. AU20]
MTSRIAHVLLTRFNLPSVSVERIIRARDGWLQERVALFERYCLPSVRAQTATGVHWIIYFDPESPDWLKTRIEEHRALGLYQPIFRASVSREELRGDIRDVVGPGCDELVTTNLDNDDGLAADALARIQASGRAGERTAIYLTQGLVRQGRRLYRFRDPHNAFCSVREPWDAPVTCWSDWHTMLGQSMPVIELGGAPGWLQVIHGRNVSNRVRGTRTRPSCYRCRFPGLVDDLAEPTARERVFDLFLALPIRALREAGRHAVKRAALGVLGREGLTRAKLIWASR